ncbi:neuronal acetylcholine receptor subunit alpha-10-like [Haliotis rufescens]|uniref:neuronal acetylcholine receptor subunit alpha-10-like n=1 Tax=Haliotis rufescens TaxID=6454 RepID=UPI00201EC0A8|nr:neuronal acetylcholine receptor subunit alpha-10-like [Haliotis rufescens]
MAQTIFACVLLLIHLFNGGAVTPNDVKELKKRIFEGYDVNIRPVPNQTESIHVDMRFILASIDNLDLKIQKLKWNGFLSLRWTDITLSWNTSEYGGLDFITVPQSNIWRPDYIINNEYVHLGVSQKKALGTSDTLVFIKSSGLVTWEPGMVSETSCKIDIRKYPFDTQTCSFDFLPWMTTSRFLNTTSLNKIDMASFVPHGEFTTGGSSVHFERINLVFTDDVLVTVRYDLVLHRRPAFYWMVMVFPMSTFPMLSPISFLVPVASGEKITLSITVVLSYFVFIGSMNDAMPKLSDTVSLIGTSILIFFSFEGLDFQGISRPHRGPILTVFSGQHRTNIGATGSGEESRQMAEK